MNHIGIAIIDVNQLVREGLEHLLCNPPFEVTASGKTMSEALGNDKRMIKVDVVVFGSSTEIEIENQIATVRQLATEPSRPHLVFVTDVQHPDLLRKVIGAGVDAVLSRDISSEVFQRSLELIMLGQQLFPISLVAEPGPAPAPARLGIPDSTSLLLMPRPVVQDPVTRPDTDASVWPAPVTLSARENQILGYIVSAFPNKVIARELHIAEATVKAHIKALLRKVRASNRTEAAVWALTRSRMPNQVIELPAATSSGN